ncbi:MAG: hypothetical protein GY749_41415 [Desulfobacteraceae bacterium]|nr:hypothetical protein [Desulfobacteraceae bacterium]MCP4344188.1 hypothetical protein [Desulfobacterales bacterium]
MKGSVKTAIYISVLITALIIGILVVKNIDEHSSPDGKNKMESVQKAEQAAEDVKKKLDAMQRQVE